MPYLTWPKERKNMKNHWMESYCKYRIAVHQNRDLTGACAGRVSHCVMRLVTGRGRAAAMAGATLAATATIMTTTTAASK